MSDKKDIVDRLESKFIQEVAATLEEVSSCLDRYADVDDGDEGQPEANAALRQKCAVDEILGRFPKARDETFLVGDRALHEFIPDTCSHGVIEWNPPIGQGYAAWVGEGKITHRHSHPTNPLVALAAAIIKQRDARITSQQEEIERLRDALEVPKVWSEAERDGMSEAFTKASEKHGHYETLSAVGAWLLRHRLAALQAKPWPTTHHMEMKMTEWLADANGNKCSTVYFGTQDAAQKALDSLKDCKDCVNCSRCSGCYDCSGCSDCLDCYDCSRCSGCYNCVGCLRCDNCYNGSDCYDY